MRIAYDRQPRPSDVARKAQAHAVGFDDHRRGTEDVPGIVGGVDEAFGDLLLLFRREVRRGTVGRFAWRLPAPREAELPDGHRGTISFTMFAAAVYELCVLLLQERGIGEHCQAQVDGSRRGVDYDLEIQ